MADINGAHLRAAVAGLYSASGQERQAADCWLRAFTGQDGAWRALLALLSAPQAAEHERFFAATALRPACQKRRELAEPATLQELVPVLAQQLAAAAAAGCWHTCNELAAALATLAVRAPSWPEQQCLPQLLALAQEALQAHASAGDEDGKQQQQQQQQQQQRMALLRLLAALPEAAASGGVSMHPLRREAVKRALAAAPEPLAAVQQALAPGSSLAVQAAALQLLQAWCGLGVPPAGFEGAAALWQLLHQAALQPQLSSAAAECVAALYGCCLPEGASSSGGGGSGAGEGGGGGALHQQRQRQHQLLSVLLGLLPGFAAQLQRALRQSQGQAQAQMYFPALTILCAAAKAADSQQAGQAGRQAVAAATAEAACSAVHLAAEVALAALQHPQFEVMLAALQHWDEQLERWQAEGTASGSGGGSGGGGGGGACSLQQRQVLLGRLCGALLQSMALPAVLPAAAASADARDLPATVKQVRREAADTFRAAADCAGAGRIRQQLLQLAADAHAEWQGAGGRGRGSGGWQQYECCLYALNIVWARQRSQQVVREEEEEEEAAAEVRRAAALVAAALQPQAPRLAGTALTLLGGMAEQLPLLLPGPLPPQEQRLGEQQQHQPRQQQQEQPRQQEEQQQQLLPHLLALLLQLVQQPGDARLSRTAATCCWRLTGSHQLATMLAANHSDWGHALCRCFVSAGGMQQRVQAGDDLTTAQFLLVSICHLASAAAAASAEGPAAAESGSELLRQLLSQPAAAAAAALAAAAAAAAEGLEQQQQQELEQAALQVETIAVALEAVAASADGASNSGQSSPATSLAQQLPRLLANLGGVLRLAAASAAAAGAASCAPQQALLLEAVCRVAAALAATPAADVPLDLLRPFVAAPQHPCVLQTLAELAAKSATTGGSSGSGSLQRLQAAISECLQAAAAQHSSDPDWQPALLALGEACLQRLPAVAADAATLDALLTTAQHSMRSYHRDVCEQVVQFSEALCCIGCQRRRVAGAVPNSAGGDPAAAQHLQLRLDGGGLGAALLLGLLLAASGAMPPYMVVEIADALHRTWQAVGFDRFGPWLLDAALQRAPPDAPWRSWKAEAQAAALADLLSPQCAQDARRFKRLLKFLCGGKKKGQHVEQPARA